MRLFLPAAAVLAILGAAHPAQAQELQLNFDPTPSLNSRDGVCLQSPNAGHPYCIRGGNGSSSGSEGSRSSGGGSPGGGGGCSGGGAT